MSISTPLFRVCSQDAAVTALLGTSPVRLYPFGEAPQGVAKPYATHQQVSGSPENYHGDRPDIDYHRLQVDVYADTGTSAIAVRTAIIEAVELQANVLSYNTEERDQDTGNYRASFDIGWLVPR